MQIISLQFVSKVYAMVITTQEECSSADTVFAGTSSCCCVLLIILITINELFCGIIPVKTTFLTQIALFML